jgi:hypothetical protein
LKREAWNDIVEIQNSQRAVKQEEEEGEGE